MRSEYSGEGLSEDDLAPTPLHQVRRWVAEAQARQAERGDVVEPTALSVATVDADGRANVRTVLMRFLDERGPGFVTDLGSTKSREISRHRIRRRVADVAGDVPGGPVPGARRPRRVATRSRPTSPRGRGDRGSARGRRTSRSRSPTGPPWSPPTSGTRPSTRTPAHPTTSPSRTGGAAGGSSATRSSCGRADATGCTTGWCSRAWPTVAWTPPRRGRSTAASPEPHPSGCASPAGRGRPVLLAGHGRDQPGLPAQELLDAVGPARCGAAARRARRPPR